MTFCAKRDQPCTKTSVETACCMVLIPDNCVQIAVFFFLVEQHQPVR